MAELKKIVVWNSFAVLHIFEAQKMSNETLCKELRRVRGVPFFSGYYVSFSVRGISFRWQNSKKIVAWNSFVVLHIFLAAAAAPQPPGRRQRPWASAASRRLRPVGVCGR